MGIPFYFVTIILFSLFVFSLVGKTIVRIDKNGGTSYTGALGIGRNRQFRWNESQKLLKKMKFGITSTIEVDLFKLKGKSE